MIPSTDLFELIKSMTREEKIHFRIHTKGLSQAESKNYLALFDAIESKTDYDEASIRKKMGMVGKGGKFAVLKNYLYNSLLTHVTNYHCATKEAYQAREYLRMANVLFDKQLPAQASKYVKKAKSIAEKNHRYLDLIGIYFQEELIYKNSPDIKKYSQTLDKHFNQELAVITQYLNTRQYIYLDCQLLNTIRTTDNLSHPDSQEKIQAILQHPLLLDGNMALSLYAQIYYNTINGIGYHILADDNKSYSYRKQLIDVMESEMIITAGYIGNYIGSLHNLTVTEIRLYKFDEALLHLQKLAAFEKQYANVIPERSKVLIHSSLAMNTLTYLGYRGTKTETFNYIAQVEKQLNESFKQMDYRYLVHTYYTVAYTAFKFAEYNIAIKYLNLISAESSTGKLDNYLQRGYRLLLLMVHLEMGNYRLLQYMAINTYRFLLKIGNLTKFDKAIIGLIRSKSMDKKVLLKFQKQLLAVKADKFEAQEFAHLDAISWVESKLEKKPFIEIYRKNGLLQ